ncbi:MAG TPA: hypothetical protein DCM28_10860 [Phycisphaerales bacterium]|nr:hypothetical protein [Phycisphaerales bacterium]
MSRLGVQMMKFSRMTTSVKMLSLLLVTISMLALQGCESQSNGYLIPCISCEPAVAAPKPAPRPAPAPIVQAPDVVCGRLVWPTGNLATSSILVEKCAPSTVQVGMPFDFTIKVKNLTGVALKNVIVKDDVPSSFNVSAVSIKPNTSGNNMVWNFGVLPAGAEKTIVITGTPTAAGKLENCLAVSHELDTCVALNVVAPALKLEKTAPASVLKCDPIPYKLTVTNTGVGDARNVVINDTLPDGIVTEDGKKNVSINVGTLPAGKSMSYTVNAKATKTGTFTNAASANAVGGLTANASSTTNVLSPDLKITKTGPAMRFLGRPVDYTITVTNTGNGVARDVVIQDIIPAGATSIATSDGGQLSGGKITWMAGDLAPAASKTVTVKVVGNQLGTIVNTASASAYCAEAVTATAKTQIKGIPAILLECVDLVDPVEVGAETTYVITVTNQGSLTGTNIRLVVNLEDTAQYVSTAGPTTASVNGKTITLAPLPTLAPKERQSWQIKVKAVGSGDVRFSVDMNSDQIDRPVKETESTNFYE